MAQLVLWLLTDPVPNQYLFGENKFEEGKQS